MVRSAGWADLANKVVADLNRLLNAMADPKFAPNPVALAQLQGQVIAHKMWLSFPEQIEAKRTGLLKQLEALRNPSGM